MDGLSRLGQLAIAQGFHIRLTLVGGAAMVLGFNARLSTRDVNAIIISSEEHDWPEDWLNDGAKDYLAGLSNSQSLFSAPGIDVHLPSLPQLLAMKLSAWRDDIVFADARRLLQEIAKDQSQEEIWRMVEPF